MTEAANAALSDDDLRQLWRDAGGSFHGPRVETGTMPEEKLLPFLRGLVGERNKLAAANAKLKADNKEMGQSFDLRWAASRRATEMWQAANPGNDLVWPDHTDLCVWLLGRDTALREALETIVALRDGYTGEDRGLMRGYRVSGDIAEKTLAESKAPPKVDEEEETANG